MICVRACVRVLGRCERTSRGIQMISNDLVDGETQKSVSRCFLHLTERDNNGKHSDGDCSLDTMDAVVKV